eukprot:c2922_g1_i1.p1 GENE.c2922_g1_i1~~c2922_g1_i1.p1  ORF type:complete len:113 (-),score=27.37 c2922_g1_i1:26-364(-)
MHEERPVLLLGALTTFGGVAAFARVRSVPSLVAGVGLGSMLVASSAVIKRQIDDNGEAVLGFSSAALTSGALAALMAYRFSKTRKPMPALPLIVAGSLCASYYIYKLTKSNN